MNTNRTPTEEQLVGYDAREYWLTMNNSWTEEQKHRFLYRLDVTKPLSVDTRIWPTIFESEGRSIPVEFNGFQDCWADFFTLQNTVAQVFQENPMRTWKLIAITLLLGYCSQEDQAIWLSRLPATNPDRRGIDWGFLGYDIADQWMLSTLSNCGFLPGIDDVPKLRAKWGPRLNEFHLFQNIHDAILFKQFSDERLREDHAPCFIFGLWIVK
jgi:hypothetical protein